MTDWTFVQAANDVTTGLTLSFGAAVTSGNVPFWFIGLNTGNALTSAADDKGNQYQIVAGGDDETLVSVFAVMPLAPLTNGPTTLTFTTSVAVTSFAFKIAMEFAPPTVPATTAICLDGTTWFAMPSAGIQGLTGLQTSPFQTTQNDVLLVAFAIDQDATFGFGAGWTGDFANVGNISFAGHKIQATPSNSNQLTFSANGNTAWGVCFGVAPVAATNFVPVQRAVVPLQTTTSVTLTLPKPATIGNFISGGFGAVGVLSTIIDNLGTHYEGNLLSTVSDHAIWWSAGATGLLTTTPQSFILTQGASQPIAATLVEWAPPPGTLRVGIGAGGAVQNHYTGANVTTLATPNMTTTAANDLIYTWITSGATVQDNPLNGFNALNHWGIKNADAYQILQSPGTIAPAWDFAASGDVILFGVAFEVLPPLGVATPFGVLGMASNEW